MRRFVQKIRRRFRSSVSPKPCILLYHRVAPFSHDPWGLSVTPETFDQQMRYLSSHRVPMALDDFVAALKKGELPSQAVSVSFDDAYRDNLVHAKPALARHNVPATVFVPTGYVGKREPFWWDELGEMVLDCPGPHSSVLQCGEEGVPLEWGMPEKTDRDPEWRGWEPPQSRRQAAFYATWSRMQKLTEQERLTTMHELRTRFRIETDPLSQPMDASELEEMIEGDLVRLGAHTVTHASLSDTTPEQTWQEIHNSLVQCRAFTKQAVEGFAYPYGNMTPEACDQVREAGFAYGCAAEAGFLDGETHHLYMLPRIPISNVVGREFSGLLAE